jgi:ribA/ribD-fused uncharacterized protein
MPDVIDSFRDEWFFLSNFSYHKFVYKGKLFKTSEHFFMACKTFDKEHQAQIIACEKPSEAKALCKPKSHGGIITLREDWENVKYRLMDLAIYLKFTQNPTIAKELIDTGDAYLIEGNTWHDNVWGNCTCGRPQCYEDGLNALGIALMNLRDKLRAM